MNVSIFKNIGDVVGTQGDLIEFLTSDKGKTIAEKIRQTTDKKERDELKKSLPCCTPSGVFSKRGKNGLLKHSGLICIDIDGSDNPGITDWQAQVEQLGHLQEVMFAGLSVSGNGAFCIIQIAYPDKHAAHFRALEAGFSQYGIKIDPACKDVSRLRFYSYNERPYINPDAAVFYDTSTGKRIAEYSPPADVSEVVELVRTIVDNGVDIVPDYKTWIECGAALSNIPEGRSMFHAISSVNSDMYDFDECDKKFDSFKSGGGIGIGTLFHHAKQHGAMAINDFKE